MRSLGYAFWAEFVRAGLGVRDRAVAEARGQERVMSMISKGTGPVERNHWRSDNGCVGEQQGRGKNPSDTEVRKRIDEL